MKRTRTGLDRMWKVLVKRTGLDRMWKVLVNETDENRFRQDVEGSG